MFSKSKPNQTETAPAKSADKQKKPAERSGPPSIVAPGLTITGNLESDGEIHVDGTVKGDISSRSVTIGENASVFGSITATDVIVSGAIEGEIIAANVRLTPTAAVTGDIHHDLIAIEAGARIEGACRRLSQSADPVPLHPRQPATAEQTDQP